MQSVSVKLFCGLPNDVLNNKIANRLPAKDLGSLRATETERWSDPMLQEMHEEMQQKKVQEDAGKKLFSAEGLPKAIDHLNASKRLNYRLSSVALHPRMGDDDNGSWPKKKI